MDSETKIFGWGNLFITQQNFHMTSQSFGRTSFLKIDLKFRNGSFTMVLHFNFISIYFNGKTTLLPKSGDRNDEALQSSVI